MSQVCQGMVEQGPRGEALSCFDAQCQRLGDLADLLEPENQESHGIAADEEEEQEPEEDAAGGSQKPKKKHTTKDDWFNERKAVAAWRLLGMKTCRKNCCRAF
eukprot:3548502-Amphidinium_carterae.1